MPVALFTGRLWGRDVIAGSFGRGRGLDGGFRVVCLVARGSVGGLGLWGIGALVCGLGAGGGCLPAGFGNAGAGLGGGFDGAAGLWARGRPILPVPVFPVSGLVVVGR
ncbi:hypothetical protein GCM10010402_42420 [Actinomadura luteofluorescens]